MNIYDHIKHVFFCLLLCFCLNAAPTWAGRDLPPHIANQIIIKHKAGTHKSYLAGINQYLGAKTKKYLKSSHISIVKFDKEHSINEALFLYQADPSVELAEPDYLFFTTDIIPNDSQFTSQWGLSNNGSNNGTADIDVNAPALWGQSLGNQNQIIAINDSGVDYNHPDLAANMWTNPGEIAANHIDDDMNGYIDDIHGINAISNSGNPMDDNGHGTHVAGIIAGVGNNNLGISGIMQEAAIIACKFVSANGAGASSDAIKCLDYVLDLKTRAQLPQNIVVTNNSWASNVYSQNLFNAIKAHNDANIIFIAAADNYGLNNDLFPTYPSNYHLPNIISVAAIDRNGLLASFSNYGTHSVHVAAPGVQILSTSLNNTYQTLDGTSLAAPFVSGLFAILSGFYPNYSAYQNKNLIIASGAKLGSLNNKIISESLIRGDDTGGPGALSCENQAVFQSTRPQRNIVSMLVNTSLNLEVLNIICSEPAGEFSANVSPTNQSIVFKDDGSDPDLKADDGLYAARFSPPETGAYEINLAGLDTIKIESFDNENWRNYNLNIDSSFNYRVISGTRLDLGDDDIAAIISPFDLKFGYDSGSLRHVYIGSNGTISLTDHQILDWENSSLPKEGFSSIIAPLWLDLDPSQANQNEGVFYELIGSAPERELVIEWRNVKHYAASGKISFQVVFKESSSELVFAYLDLDFNSLSYNGGQQASIGLQVGNMSVNLAENAVPIANQSSFTFSLSPLPPTNSGGNSGGGGSNNGSDSIPSNKISSRPPHLTPPPSLPNNISQAPANPVMSQPETEIQIAPPQLRNTVKTSSCSSTDAPLLWPSFLLIFLWRRIGRSPTSNHLRN